MTTIRRQVHQIPIAVVTAAILCAATPFAIGHAVSPIQAGDLEAKQRFLEEAPRKWREYQAKIDVAHGTVTFLHVKDGKTVQQFRAVHKRNDRCKMVSTQGLFPARDSDVSERGDVWGFNANYAFHLQRKKEANPWVVKDIAKQRHDAINPLATQFDHAGGENNLRCLIRTSAGPLLDLVASPNFVVLKAETVIHKGVGATAIQFSVEQVFNKVPVKEAGTLVLLPAQHWCLLAYEITTTTPDADSKFESDIELVDRTAMFPLPRRDRMKRDLRHAKYGRIVETWDIHYDLKYPTNPPPDSEFTLSAFGFLEPPGMEFSRPIPWLVWLAVAGLICLIGGVIIVRRKSRAAKTVA